MKYVLFVDLTKDQALFPPSKMEITFCIGSYVIHVILIHYGHCIFYFIKQSEAKFLINNDHGCILRKYFFAPVS